MLNWLSATSVAAAFKEGLYSVTHAVEVMAGAVTRGQHDPLFFDYHQNSACNVADTIYAFTEMAATFVVVPWITRSLVDGCYKIPYKKVSCKLKVGDCEDASIEDVAKTGLHWMSNLWIMQPVKWMAQGLRFVVGSPVRFLKHQLISQVLYHAGLKNLWLAMKPAALALLRPPLERAMPAHVEISIKGIASLILRAPLSLAGEGTFLTTISKPLVGLRGLYRYMFTQQGIAEKIAPNLYEFSEKVTDALEWGLVTTWGFFKGIGTILPAIGSGSNGVAQALSDATAWVSERFGGAWQALSQLASPTLVSWAQWITNRFPKHIFSMAAGGAKFVNDEVLWKFAEHVGEFAPEHSYVPNLVYGIEVIGLAYGGYKGSGYMKSLSGWGFDIAKTSIENVIQLAIEKAFGSPVVNTNINHIEAGGVQRPGNPAIIYNQINNQHQINNGQPAAGARPVPGLDANDDAVVDGNEPPPVLGAGVGV